MLLKKFNAVIGILLSLMLLLHLSLYSYNNIVFCAKRGINLIEYYSFLVLLILHVVISMYEAIKANIGKSKKGFGYPQYNKKTFIQRITGLIMIVFSILHIIIVNAPETEVKFNVGSAIGFIVLNAIIIALALFHFRLSFFKALITLSIIKNDKQEKALQIVSIIVFLAIFIISLTGIIMFVVGNMGA